MPDSRFFPRGISIRGGAFGIRSVGSISSSSEMNSVGDLNISAGGVDLAVFNATSGTNLVSYGAHYSSGTTATFLLADPEVGRTVEFHSLGATTGTTYTFVLNTTGTNIASATGGYNVRQFAMAGGAGTILMGLTTAIYGVVGVRGSVVFSSST